MSTTSEAAAPDLDPTTLDQIVKLLVQAASPRWIVLFGSYARGAQTEDSDIDLLVAEEEVIVRAAESIKLRHALTPIRMPIDILVYADRELEDADRWLGTAVYDVLNGKQLYAAE
jgi:uncharacterized protein